MSIHREVPRYYDLGDKWPFREHRGDTVEEVIRKHPRHVEWCLDNLDHFELEDDAAELLDFILDAED